MPIDSDFLEHLDQGGKVRTTPRHGQTRRVGSARQTEHMTTQGVHRTCKTTRNWLR